MIKKFNSFVNEEVGIRNIKSEAQKKINQILADVWGVEFLEPIKVEVEDE